jgi:hypothetical protein
VESAVLSLTLIRYALGKAKIGVTGSLPELGEWKRYLHYNFLHRLIAFVVDFG